MMTLTQSGSGDLRGYLDLPDLEAPIDQVAMFGRQAPLEVEIGAGRGDFLLGYAARCPGHDFLGVERKLVYLRRGVNKIGRAGLTNVRLLNVEARNLMAHYFRPGCLHAVHIYFPDPWPKQRHEHRRIVSPDFLASCIRALEPGGYLHLRTDHADYFPRMLKAVETLPVLKPVEIPAELLEVQTGFEKRFLEQGLPIYRASFQLTCADR